MNGQSSEIAREGLDKKRIYNRVRKDANYRWLEKRERDGAPLRHFVLGMGNADMNSL